MKPHILYIDTREQTPFSFVGYSGLLILRKKLDFGDYGMRFSDSYKARVVFERKSIPDLFGTLTNGHDRFKRELEKAKANNYKLIIVVEGTIKKVLKGVWKSKIQGTAIVKTLFTYTVKHNIFVHYAPDRDEASRYIVEYFAAEWRKHREEWK